MVYEKAYSRPIAPAYEPFSSFGLPVPATAMKLMGGTSMSAGLVFGR